MEKPVIALIPLYDDEKEGYWMLPGYMKMIEEAGAIAIMLPMINDHASLKQMAKQCDGFLFTGGHDVSPHLYHETIHHRCGIVCKKRDEMEKELFDIVYQMDKPMLGICRGLQLFNVLLGGTLYQDLLSQQVTSFDHHQLPPYDITVHHNIIVKETPLYALLKQEKIAVNSYHHQAIKDLSSQLKVMAYSEDGLIEAVYHPFKKYLQAFQWHPEYLLQEKSSQLIIEEFIRKCQESCFGL